MPENWKTYKLGEIADIKGGKRLPKGEVLVSFKTVHPYIRVTDMSNRTIPIEKLQYVTNDIFPKISRYIVNTDDLILSIVGTVGSVSIIDQKLNNASLTENCVKITNLRNLDSNFLYYYLISNSGQNEINKGVVGSTQPKLPIYNINNIGIDLPEDLKEQKAIASILSALDDKIELNLQMNKTLEEMAMALYKHWFVDFGPFQNGKFVESELGMIPEGWEVKKLGEFVKHQKGFAFKSSWYQDHGRIVVRVSDTTANSIDLTTCNKISDEQASNYKDYELLTNDIIIATVGSWPPNYSSVVGKVVKVPSIAEGGLLNQNAVRLKMKFNDVDQQGLLYCTLKTDRFLNYIVNSAQGSASQASIKLTDIFNYPISITKDIKLEDFSNQIDVFLNQQNSLIEEIQTLTTLRDTLLPKLISGEIRVKDAEQMVATSL
jgi:type I restriction enzyme S subunit